MWNSGQVSSSSTSATYAGATLSRGVTYYVQVRTYDGYEWSSWATGTFRLNQLPVVQILAPENGRIFYVGDSISFVSSSSDPDGDALTRLWDFNDGSTAATENATHAYQNVGTYLVKFSAYDGYENVVDSVTITLLPKIEPTGGAGAGLVPKLVEEAKKIVLPPENVLFKPLFSIGIFTAQLWMILIGFAALSWAGDQKGIALATLMVFGFLMIYGGRL
jgi:hypothetical protein